DEEHREPERNQRGREVAEPGAARDDGREDVEVRVSHRVARPAAFGPEPEPDRGREDEKAEQQPRALEADRGHADLEQSACTWTKARTPASSASPRTRTETLRSPTDCEPEMLETRLSLGGVRVAKAKACEPPTTRSPLAHRATTVVDPGRTRTVCTRLVTACPGWNACADPTEVGTR